MVTVLLRGPMLNPQLTPDKAATTTPAILKKVTALILCGGQGKRLRPKFTMVPKVLVPVRGEPMLNHILLYLGGQGFKNYTFATGYLSEQIETFVASRR